MIKTIGEINKKSESGIYLILNVETEKFYIGSSKNMNHRWIEHKSGLNRNCHVNKKLQNSWNKNSDRFKAFIVENCKKEDLLDREQFYLDKYQPYKRDIGYNLNKKANGGDFYSLFSDEQKQAFVKKCVRKGEKNGMYGKSHTEDAKKKQKKKSVGRYTLKWFIEKYGNVEGNQKYRERCKSLSERNINYTYSNGQLGTKRKPLSEETKKKISNSKTRMKEIEPELKKAIVSKKFTVKEMETMFNITKPTILNRKRKYLK